VKISQRNPPQLPTMALYLYDNPWCFSLSPSPLRRRRSFAAAAWPPRRTRALLATAAEPSFTPSCLRCPPPVDRGHPALPAASAPGAAAAPTTNENATDRDREEEAAAECSHQSREPKRAASQHVVVSRWITNGGGVVFLPGPPLRLPQAVLDLAPSLPPPA
jgi:hypothetical protein